MLEEQVFNIAEYVPVLLFMGITFCLTIALLLVSYIIVPQKGYKDKNKEFECGFDGFQDGRKQFDIRFYLVAILFIIFDLEIVFLVPWVVSLGVIGNLGFWSMMVFLNLLIVGFIYEWKKGALEWE